MEVVFSTNVINGPGTDLVLFEAFGNIIDYAISTEFDGFSTELSLPTSSFVDTGEDRSYFGNFSGGGPAASDVLAGEIDLSDIGVTDGAKINAVRFRAVAFGADPLGMGYIGVIPEPASGMVLVSAVSVLAFRRNRRVT